VASHSLGVMCAIAWAALSDNTSCSSFHSAELSSTAVVIGMDTQGIIFCVFTEHGLGTVSFGP